MTTSIVGSGDKPGGWEAPSCLHLEKRKEALRKKDDLQSLLIIGSRIVNLLLKEPYRNSDPKKQYAYFREALEYDLELAMELNNMRAAYDAEYNEDRLEPMWKALYSEAEKIHDEGQRSSFVKSLNSAKVNLENDIQTVKYRAKARNKMAEYHKAGSIASRTIWYTFFFAIAMAMVHGICYLSFGMKNLLFSWQALFGLIFISLVLGYLMAKLRIFLYK